MPWKLSKNNTIYCNTAKMISNN